MPKTTEGRRKTKISRREVLRRGTMLGALPLTLAIPSRAHAIVTTTERLRSFRNREVEFEKALQEKLAQATGVGPGSRQAPGQEFPPPFTYNTIFDTTKSTSAASSTRSGSPPQADDTSTDTYHDGSTTDYRTDQR